jgi:hypothetical protein
MKCAAPLWVGVLATALSLTQATPVGAQAGPTGSPKVEIGTSASGFIGSDAFGLGLRLTGARSARIAIEGEIDWTDAGHKQHYADQITWFYFWQVKHTLHSEGASTLFATYGTAGWIQRAQSGRAFSEGRFDSELIMPFLPLIGIGWQRVLGERLAFRVDGQLLLWPFESGFIAPRIGGGISIPLSSSY